MLVMLISFLGSPRSGKTTTAARVFANLKEASFPCEFIPEQARMYIAQKRVSKNLKPSDSLVLTNEDQTNIMIKQKEIETIMLQACGNDTIIVTDSSPLNALLYMDEETKNSSTVKNLTTKILQTPTIFFYSTPVEWLGGVDPNRVHSKEQSLVIDSKIVSNIIPLLEQEPVTLFGDVDIRWKTAVSHVLKSIMAL